MSPQVTRYKTYVRLLCLLGLLWGTLGALKAETTPTTPPEGMRYLTIVVHHQGTTPSTLTALASKHTTPLDPRHPTKHPVEYTKADTLELHLKIGAPIDLTPIWIESSPGHFVVHHVGQTPVALAVQMVKTTLKINSEESIADHIADTLENNIAHTDGNTTGDTLRIYGEFCYVDCADHGASITTIDASHQAQISTLLCQNNAISSLDITACEVIWALDCRGNKLKNLSLNTNANLTYLYCDDNALSTLDLSANRQLVICSCSHNQLVALKLDKNKKLLQLFCDYNLLSTLHLTHNKALRALNCAHNKLQSLDIANGKNAKFENADGFAFNAQSNPGLKEIHIDKNFTPSLSGNNIWFKDLTANWTH